MEDGRIIKFSSDGLSHEVIAQTGGRPLGLQFNSKGNLLVCDAYKGLLSIGMDSNITILTTEHDGKPFKLTDDLDILTNGTIYFTDASYKYSLANYWPNDFPHSNGGYWPMILLQRQRVSFLILYILQMVSLLVLINLFY